MTYECWDDGCGDRVDIDADSPEEAAREYVDGGDWGYGYVSVRVQDEDGDITYHDVVAGISE